MVGISLNAYPNSVVSNTDFIVSVSVVNAGQVTIPSLGENKTDMYRVGIS